MRGFTLIELIACIAIIAVLAALAGPRFVGTQSFDERGYADELAAALRYADGVAVATGCNVSFTVTAAGPTAGYDAWQQAKAGNTCAAAGLYTQQVMRADGTALKGTPPADANVGTGGTIVFGATGGVVSATVSSFSIGPDAVTISVDASSGFVTSP